MYMVMDEPFRDKPACWGLRPGWTASMMGMMTLLRILPPALYDRIQELEAAQERDPGLRLPDPPSREAFLGGDAGPHAAHHGG
jgi:hypothetical protein